MERRDVVKLVNERLTYKPGWEIAAEPSYYDDHTVFVYVAFRAPNSSPWSVDPRPEVAASADFIVDSRGSKEDVEGELFRGLMRAAEEHEAREFFRVDGFAPFHPHRNDGHMAFARIGGSAYPVSR